MMTQDDSNKDKKQPSGKTMGSEWSSGITKKKKLFENLSDFDIYCDRQNNQNYIFHAGALNCTIDHLEYNPETQRITIITNDGQKLDLGTRIQWLIRPYIAKDQTIFIVRTENREMKEGIQVPLFVKKPEIPVDDGSEYIEDEKNLN